MQQCDNYVAVRAVQNVEKLINTTGMIFDAPDFYKGVYLVFDWALILTKITSMLHPIAFYCWNGSEHTVNTFAYIIKVKNGYTLKPYMMNTIYNFGHIFDSLKDFYLFLT